MLSCHADPAEPEGSIRCKGAAPFWSLALDVDLAATRKRPVLPSRFLEHNHRILRVVPRRGETGHIRCTRNCFFTSFECPNALLNRARSAAFCVGLNYWLGLLGPANWPPLFGC